MKLFPVKLLAFVIRKVYTAICPETLGKKCKNSAQCAGMERCYRDLDGTPNKTSSYCCRMICPHTKLLTYHSLVNKTYSYKMEDEQNINLSEMYYKHSDSDIACPFPYSHTMISMEKVLPEGFSTDSTTELKKCKTNGDCGEGFYCGYSVNPSFGTGNDRITALDESDDGDTMRFCYKNPIVDSKFVIVFTPTAKGLPLCNENSECSGMGAICYQHGQSEQAFRGDNANDRKKGICVRALLCENAGSSNKTVAVLTKNGTYCTNADDCTGIQDEVYLPECVRFENAKTTSGSLCCFTPTMCEYGTPRIPKVSCKSSADCNVGRSGPWSSWCDEKGFCCHDTNGAVQHLCPDGATFALNEPKCTDTCENGICVNGRCCPGLKVENGKVTLGTSPYITRMPCNPNEALPAYFRFSYCSYQKVVVVFGTHNAFGNEFKLSEQKNCETNQDCEQVEEVADSKEEGGAKEEPQSKEEQPDSNEDSGAKEEPQSKEEQPDSNEDSGAKDATASKKEEQAVSQEKAVLKEKTVAHKSICIRGNGSSWCGLSPFKELFGKESSFGVWEGILIAIILVVLGGVAVAAWLIFWPCIKRKNKTEWDRIGKESNDERKRAEELARRETKKKLEEEKLKKEREYNNALAEYRAAISTFLTLVSGYFDAECNGSLPPMTLDNAMLCVKMGWVKFAYLHNVLLSRSKCYFDFAVYVLQEVAYQQQMDRFAKMNPLFTLFKKNPKISKEDLENGNREKLDVILDNVHVDPVHDRRVGLTEADKFVSNSSATTEEASLPVDRTQSDHSNRATAGEENEELRELVGDLNYEQKERLHEAISIIKAGVQRELKAREYKNRSRVYKAFHGCCNVCAYAWQSVKFWGEPEFEGNHDIALPEEERLEAGRNKTRWTLNNFMNEAYEKKYRNTYKEGEKTFTDRTEFAKYKFDNGCKEASKAELYDTLLTAYIGKAKESPGKEIEILKEALVVLKKGEKEIGAAGMLEKKCAIYVKMVHRGVTPELVKDALEVLDKMIERNAMWKYVQARAEILFSKLLVSPASRKMLFGTSEVDMNRIMADLERANELLPNQPRTFLIMAKLEKIRGNMDLARQHMQSATSIEPNSEDETAQKNEAIQEARNF